MAEYEGTIITSDRSRKLQQQVRAREDEFTELSAVYNALRDENAALRQEIELLKDEDKFPSTPTGNLQKTTNNPTHKPVGRKRN